MTTEVTQDQANLKKDETTSLIAAPKEQDTDVYNTGGEHVGDVDDVIIDKASGKIAYAIVRLATSWEWGKTGTHCRGRP